MGIKKRKSNGAFLSRKLFVILMSPCFGGFMASCTHVQPWEKQYLANPYMALDSDPLESKLREHIFFSKEAASGGYGPGGGGCGCN